VTTPVTQFILRRLLITIPVLIGIVFVVFVLARLVPGDPCRAVLGERATDAVCDDFIHRYGLDQPIPVQFVAYLGQLASGDLGTSIKHSRPVTTLLVERLPTTIELTIMAMIFAVAVGVPLGLISAYRRNSAADMGTMVLANLGVSVPVFVLGLVLAFLFAIVLKDTPFSLPPSGRLSTGVSVVPLAVWGTGRTARACSISRRAPLRPSSPDSGAPGSIPSVTSSCRRSRSGPSRWRSSPGSRGQACSRSSGWTTCGRPGQRDSGSEASSCGMPPGTPCCRS
jgi:ABC-type dipeptide/oligopeptide/nickel transport system permease component